MYRDVGVRCHGVHACTRITRGAYTDEKGVSGNAKSLFNFDRRSCKPRCLAGINPDPVAKYDRRADDVIVLS